MAAAGVIPAKSAAEPPEARGLRRDEVRLLVSHAGDGTIEHARFVDLPRFLDAGDVLVVNTSGTMNAALPATALDGTQFELHLSTRLPGGFWTVEVRRPGGNASLPYLEARAGHELRLPAGGRATLLAPYPLNDSLSSPSRLWLAAVNVPSPLSTYLDRFAAPIRYEYVPVPWPAAMYQTVFATETGSAEMPSAGRPFTPELVTTLVSRGVQFAPILLHTGVASLEDHEPPYEEFFRVTRETSSQVNAARRRGHRIVAVGTTAVRALETVADEGGRTSPGEGWTNLVITPERPLRAVNALITGLHEPRATHLAIVEQAMAAARRVTRRLSSARGLSDRQQIERAYDEARQNEYLWHEFGDAHLIVGTR